MSDKFPEKFMKKIADIPEFVDGINSMDTDEIKKNGVYSRIVNNLSPIVSPPELNFLCFDLLLLSPATRYLLLSSGVFVFFLLNSYTEEYIFKLLSDASMHLIFEYFTYRHFSNTIVVFFNWVLLNFRRSRI